MIHCSLVSEYDSVQDVETSVNVITSSLSQDYTHLDDHNLLTYDMTPGFKPFTELNYLNYSVCVDKKDFLRWWTFCGPVLTQWDFFGILKFGLICTSLLYT